jgi:hypothetical protein
MSLFDTTDRARTLRIFTQAVALQRLHPLFPPFLLITSTTGPPALFGTFPAHRAT